MRARLRDGLVLAGFIQAPHGQSHALPLGVGLLGRPPLRWQPDPGLLPSPRLRLCTAMPVRRRVLSFCQMMPALCKTAQMVYMLTFGGLSHAAVALVQRVQ
jgi:hypothetical protein